jgi:UDP-N-acetylmuramate--alanine ligase
VSWDHHEIFKTREDYKQAFLDFIEASAHTLVWQEDADYLELNLSDRSKVVGLDEAEINGVDLLGKYNRRDAWLAIQSVKEILNKPADQLVEVINRFPGLSRRMEMIVPNLFSDYAHTPEKIIGAMSVATEMAKQSDQSVVIVYEPLTNRRQHYMIKDYGDSFNGASVVYWLPSYLAREDPAQKIIEPDELIASLSDPSIGRPMKRDHELKEIIQKHLDDGDMVVGLAGGGGGSLDDWLRQEFKS